MNTARLRRAIEIMREIEAKELPFDMHNWIAHFDADRLPAFGKYEHTCGTAGCLMGWCALDPTFQQEGLQLLVTFEDEEKESKSPINIKSVAQYNELAHDETVKFWCSYLKFNDHTGVDAAAEFFEIGYKAAKYLVYAYSYKKLQITPADVISHLEDVLYGRCEEIEEKDEEEEEKEEEEEEEDDYEEEEEEDDYEPEPNL